MIHINVNQSSIIEPNVNTSVIDKIYDLIQEQKKSLNYYDNQTNFIGKIRITYTYEKYVEEINTAFPSLEILYDGLYVLFEDPLIQAEMVRLFGDVNGGVIAASVTRTSFYNEFDKSHMIEKYGQDNWQIRSFNELSKFPTIVELSSSNGWTFFEQNLLESIDLTRITTLGQNTFCGCSSLRNLGDTSNIKTMRIGGQFNGCSSLTSFNLSPQLIALPAQVFQDCTSLSSIDLSHVTSIGSRAFQNCTSLSNIDISNVTSLGTYTFESCPIETVNLNENVTVIPEFCFYNCSSLKTINLTNITTIELNAFNGRSSLNNVTFHNVTKFGSGCFANCTSLGVNQILELNLDGTSNWGANVFRNTGYKEIILHETTYHKISGFAGSGQGPSFGYQCNNLIKIDLSDTKQTSQGATYSYNVTTMIMPETWDGTLHGRDWGSSLLYFIVLRTDPPAHTHSGWDWYGLPSNCAMYVPDEAYNDYVSVWVTTGGTPSERIKRISELPSNVTWYTKEHPTT